MNIKKLARLMRRGKLDEERQRIIGQAEILGALHVKRQNERKAKKKAAIRAASSSG
jgi:hypothetical protein